jgi:hypothetical protein
VTQQSNDDVALTLKAGEILHLARLVRHHSRRVERRMNKEPDFTPEYGHRNANVVGLERDERLLRKLLDSVGIDELDAGRPSRRNETWDGEGPL